MNEIVQRKLERMAEEISRTLETASPQSGMALVISPNANEEDLEGIGRFAGPMPGVASAAGCALGQFMAVIADKLDKELADDLCEFAAYTTAETAANGSMSALKLLRKYRHALGVAIGYFADN